MLKSRFSLLGFQNHLPEVMPSVFNATYTPIAAAGTQAQIKHVARLLATQLNSAGLGPGATIAKTQKPILVCSIYFFILLVI